MAGLIGKKTDKKNKKRAESLSSGFKDNGYSATPLVHRDKGELDFFRKRAFLSALVIILFFAILITRLWFLQIQQGEMYSRLADNNRVRHLEIAAPRGNIVDRKGREIATNRPSFNVVWIREDNRLDDDLIKQVAGILNVDVMGLLAKIRKAADNPGHIPIRLGEDITWEQVARIENNRLSLPGIRIEVVPLRFYHHGNLASHVIGYLAEISRERLQAAEPGIYRGGDLVGKVGLERLREEDLRGEKGRHYMEVNVLGFEQRNLKGIEPLPGNDLQLTIDIDLQLAAEKAMRNGESGAMAGAVVAVEVNTGRMLVLASTPTLEIDKFVGGIPHKDWQEMLNNPYKPLLNRLVQGQYPPASTYKMVVALAGLSQGVITPETVVYCPGHYRFRGRTYHCWNRSGHGAVALNEAMAESCDVYFYKLGKWLGVDRIAKYARLFGLGRKTGIEMQGEESGLVPTAEWKKRERGEAWQEGETLSVAIGQGFNLVTPVQLAFMTAMIANGGTLYKPGLVDIVRDPDGNIIESFEPQVVARLTGQGRNLRIIRQGMVEAVAGRHGTGRRARLDELGITVAGKTGTAQVVRLKKFQHLKDENIPYQYRDHALFVAFAPVENPEIAVTVVVEHGLQGGAVAAPVARDVMEAYFRGKGIMPGDVSVGIIDDAVSLMAAGSVILNR